MHGHSFRSVKAKPFGCFAAFTDLKLPVLCKTGDGEGIRPSLGLGKALCESSVKTMCWQLLKLFGLFKT